MKMFKNRDRHDSILCCVPKRVRCRVFSVLLVAISLVSLVVQRTLLQNVSSNIFDVSANTFLTNPSRSGDKNPWHNNNEGDSVVACKLPEVDPFHPSVVEFVKDLGRLHCEGPNYSSFENNVLWVEGEDIVSAQYRKIERTPGDDFNVLLSDPVIVHNTSGNCVPVWNFKGTFCGNASVDTDFIRVDVVTSSGETRSDVHMQVFPKKEVVDRQPKPGGIPLDVALIMFDSTSAANFERKMPNSLEYLTKELDSTLLRGETIVGDGTTAQLSALLTGIEEKLQPEARRRKASSQPVDNWRWIFRDFKDKGYATMFSEDMPGAASFNYRLNGFQNPPTDHYARPFWMEAVKIKGKYCINSRASHDASLKYLLSFFRGYTNRPKFAFSSHAEISHDSINTVGYADEDLKAVLQTMEKESLLENTLLIIFADHGPRFSNFRKTMQGKLEERFPFMSITTPKWFRGKYPDLYNNLAHNAHVLTSPFDVYATLRHLLSYPEYPSEIIIGQSLFSWIDEKNRTCASAGVEDHWCPCLDLEEVSSDEPVVVEVAEFLVKRMNELTSQSHELTKLCQRLVLKKIKSVFREMPKGAMQRFRNTKNGGDDECDSCETALGDRSENTLANDTLYQLQLVTSPNGGFYEASVRLTKGAPSLVGDISRIDAYKDQPYCIMETFPLLRKFCYCSSINEQ